MLLLLWYIDNMFIIHFFLSFMFTLVSSFFLFYLLYTEKYTWHIYIYITHKWKSFSDLTFFVHQILISSKRMGAWHLHKYRLKWILCIPLCSAVAGLPGNKWSRISDRSLRIPRGRTTDLCDDAKDQNGSWASVTHFERYTTRLSK